MIKINLSPLRRPKTNNQGTRMFVLALLVWGGFAVSILMLVHLPMTDQIEQLQRSVNTLQAENADKANQLKGYEELKRTIADAEARAEVVNRLNQARAVPAHMLFELSLILTSNKLPTMTPEVRKQIEEGRIREFVREWDPSNVWITSFVEDKDGAFRIQGVSQSDSDMTQLALRLDASVYFDEVEPVGGSETTDKQTGSTAYEFTITGKVAY
jgi:Tfp pilus assembly protein PilN